MHKGEICDMKKQDLAIVGFEVIAFAGEARSKLIKALSHAERGYYEVADALAREAGEGLLKAHDIQTQMLAAEALGNSVEFGFVMVHAQDHLMTTMLLKDIIDHLLNIYKKPALEENGIAESSA